MSKKIALSLEGRPKDVLNAFKWDDSVFIKEIEKNYVRDLAKNEWVRRTRDEGGTKRDWTKEPTIATATREQVQAALHKVLMKKKKAKNLF